MKRNFFGISAVIIVVVIGAYGVIAYAKPSPAFAAKTTANVSIPDEPSLAWPVHGEAAVGALGYGELEMHGTQKAQPTASVAKVMTALAVLKAHPLQLGQQGPELTITQADVDNYNSYVAEDGSVAKVAVGEKISEYEALQAMLLPSADNIADTLAKWSYGSLADYSSTANAMAVNLGMTDTHIGTTDASGYSPDTVSTAHDLILLGQAALQNPVLAQIVSQPTANIPVAGTVQNVNWLLGKDGINGIKTGNTDQAGGVYLFSATETFTNGQSVTVIGVVMDTSATLLQALDESVPLLHSLEDNFKLTPLVMQGQVMGTYNVPWVGDVNAVANGNLSAVTWQGQKADPTVTLKNLNAPIVKGAQIGTVSFGNTTNKTVPIIVEQNVPSPTWQWRLSHAL